MEPQRRSRYADPADVLDKGGARTLGEAGVAADQQLAPIDQQNMATPFAEAILARRADKPRDTAKIKTILKAEAAAWGNKWMYGWDVKSGQDGKKQRVEGGTIKMANAIARHFGNCIVETRVFDEGANWTFYARFVDLETGYTLVRAYRQRKQANIGMRDEQRALDIVFAIGQSKAIRNVVLNALPDLEAFCREEAKSATIAEIEAKPDGARKWILKTLGELGVDHHRVEAQYGRTSEHWTVPDMAKIVAEVESVQEGMMNADDVWPAVGENKAEAQKKETLQRTAPPKPPQGKVPAGAESLQYSLEDGTRLPYDTQGPVPKEGDPVELGGKLHHVLAAVRDEQSGAILVTVKAQKVVEAPKAASAGPVEATPPQRAAAPAGEATPPAGAPKRNLFGKPKGG